MSYYSHTTILITTIICQFFYFYFFYLGPLLCKRVIIKLAEEGTHKVYLYLNHYKVAVLHKTYTLTSPAGLV